MFLSVIVIATDGQWSPSNATVYGVFAACVLLHAILASTLSKITGKLQTAFVIANILLIVITIIVLPAGTPDRNNGEFIFATVENGTTWPIGWTFMLSWLSAMWTIGAFDSCVHMAEEASNAARAVPIGIIAATSVAGFLGTIILIVIAACIDPNLSNVIGTVYGQPMAQIYYDAVGKQGALAMMTLMFCVQFFMGLSILVAASRQTWAFSRDGALPFSKFFRPISKRFGYIPLRTVWGCALLAIVLGLLALIDAAAASALFSLSICGGNVSWFIPIFSRVMWGRKKFVPGPIYTGDKLSLPIAIIACVYLVFGTILAMFPLGGPNPTPDVMNYAVLINVAVWGGALLYYFIDARKWFTGPKTTIEAEDPITNLVTESFVEKDTGINVGEKEKSSDGSSQ